MVCSPLLRTTMKLAPLFGFLNDLEGHDVEKMPQADGRRFCEVALDKFRVLAAPIPGLVLGPHIADGYAWHTESSQWFCGDYVGSLKFVHTGKMDAALGESGNLRMAAALFPDAAFSVALYCEFHRDGGLQSRPRLVLSLSTDGRIGVARMGKELCKVEAPLKKALSQSGVVETRVRATENACDDVVNPLNVGEAFEAVASSARRAAREGVYGDGDDLVTERVDVSVDLAAVHADAPATAQEVLRVLGGVFVAISSR